eukprot:909522_1
MVQCNEESRKVVLSIEGMSCASCVLTIENGVRSLKGVRSVTVSLLLNSSEIVYDRKLINADKISAEVADLGFETLIKSDATVDGARSQLLCVYAHSLVTVKAARALMAELREVRGVIDCGADTKKPNILTITFDPSVVGPRRLMKHLSDLGHPDASPYSGDASHAYSGDVQQREMRQWRRRFVISISVAVPIWVVMMLMPMVIGHQPLDAKIGFQEVTYAQILLLVVVTPIQFGVGSVFYSESFRAARRGHFPMSALVASATTVTWTYAAAGVGAAAAGEPLANTAHFFETSSTLITFIVLGKFLESSAKRRTSAALRALSDLQPRSCVLLRFDENSSEVIGEDEIDIALVERGDVLKVVRGSRIPTDGVVVHGSGTVDESMISGESMPVSKSVDARVTGATVLTDGLLRVRVSRTGAEGALAQIVKLMEEAQTGKAPIQAIADRISNVFVPVVFLLAFCVFFIWLSIGLQSEEETGKVVENAIAYFVTTVVIACPCALGLATPTAIMVGTGKGAEYGVLIKGGDALETAHKVSAIIFDKTGTLTHGKPSVVDFSLLRSSSSRSELIRLCGAAELGSEHTLGRAVVDYAREHASSLPEDKQNLPQPESFHAISGMGLRATVEGADILIGNRAWMDENKVEISDEIHNKMMRHEQKSRTVLCVSIDGRPAALVALADAVKPESAAVVRALRARGAVVWMVTGDNRRTATAVGRQVGIDNILAEVLPRDKYLKVAALQKAGHVVAVVGDGINDSPALAQADLGIAIGAGTDIAVEAASTVLVRPDLRGVLTALELSRSVVRRIRMNFGWALGYNLVGLPVAAGALSPIGVHFRPEYAALAMSLSSVCVVCSSLLLKLWKPKSLKIDDLPPSEPLSPSSVSISIRPSRRGTLLEAECACKCVCRTGACVCADKAAGRVGGLRFSGPSNLHGCQCPNCNCDECKCISSSPLLPTNN